MYFCTFSDEVLVRVLHFCEMFPFYDFFISYFNDVSTTNDLRDYLANSTAGLLNFCFVFVSFVSQMNQAIELHCISVVSILKLITVSANSRGKQTTFIVLLTIYKFGWQYWVALLRRCNVLFICYVLKVNNKHHCYPLLIFHWNYVGVADEGRPYTRKVKKKYILIKGNFIF